MKVVRVMRVVRVVRVVRVMRVLRVVSVVCVVVPVSRGSYRMPKPREFIHNKSETFNLLKFL